MRGLRRLLRSPARGWMMVDVVQRLGGPPAAVTGRGSFLICEAGEDRRLTDAYRRLREAEFVRRQGLFAASDLDEADGDPLTRVLVAVGPGGDVLGGVRVHQGAPDGAQLGWWRGSRLVTDRAVGSRSGRMGAALVCAACAVADELGALRFDATVQERYQPFFERLGWTAGRVSDLGGAPHVEMHWPVERFQRLVDAHKEPLGALVGELLPADRWRGDDAYPLPGSDLVTSVDAITPAMVERDPEWAGWCGVLVTAHDLAAMGASPVCALDALGARDARHAGRVLDGVRRASDAFDLPVVGGHTQLGVPAALALTGFGRTSEPVPGGGARPGDALTVTADLDGGWRPGYRGRQWDSTSFKTREQLTAMLATVARCRPVAAKDVSMAGIVGTAGMLAEASGCGAELTVEQIPRPAEAGLADWLTCFPGYGVLSADRSEARPVRAAGAVSASCGILSPTPGVRLRWPDGELTVALSDSKITGLGAAHA